MHIKDFMQYYGIENIIAARQALEDDSFLAETDLNQEQIEELHAQCFE